MMNQTTRDDGPPMAGNLTGSPSFATRRAVHHAGVGSGIRQVAGTTGGAAEATARRVAWGREDTPDDVGAGRLHAALMPMVILLCLPLAACKMVPQDVLLPKEVLVAREEAAIQKGKRGFYMPVISWAGKFDYERQGTDEIIRLAWDDEKSFRDAMLGLTVTTASLANMAAKKAEEETARIAAQESTKKAAAAEAAKLNALKESNRHAEALMEFEAAAPVAPAVPVP